MKKLFTTLSIALAVTLTTTAQTGYRKAYTLFDSQGKEIGYETLIDSISKADVILIGEIHNCAITHWLELEITRSLYNLYGDSLMMGAEMFESDNQMIMDEYMHRIISYERFEEEARLWPNYSTDYYPFVYFAKEHEIPFIATNVPRRYANVVKEKGLEFLDSLSDEAKHFLPPLPIKFEFKHEQKEMFDMMHAIGGTKHNQKYLSQAQAIKDATMGWFIAKNIRHKFLHFNGNYHSDRKGGIIPYLMEYRPGTTIKTICSVRQENINHLDEDNIERADFYICVPEDMTTTY